MNPNARASFTSTYTSIKAASGRRRWHFSEDCPLLVKTRLTLGKFLPDLSWLLVASVMKRISFHIRTIREKLVYQIITDNEYGEGSSSMHAVNFTVQNGVSLSKVVEFNPADTVEEETESPIVKQETDLYPYDGVIELRRSKRRNVRPDRFLGCSLDSNEGWIRMMPYRYNKWSIDEEDIEYDVEDDDEDGEDDDDLYVPLSHLFGKKGRAPQERDKGNTKASSKDKKGRILLLEGREKTKNTGRMYGRREGKSELSMIPFTPTFEPIPLEQFGLNADSWGGGFSRSNYMEAIDKYRSKAVKHGKKLMSDLEEMESDLCWKGSIGKSVQRRKSHSRSIVLKTDDIDGPKIHTKKTLSAGAYNKLIDSYMKNIDSTIAAKDEPTNVVEQWEELKKVKASSKQNGENDETSSEEDDGETSENEMLWREMELCLASSYILDDNEARVDNEAIQKSNGGCEHDYRLDEEIGLLCRLCGHIKTEIKHVSAPFAEHKKWTTEKKQIDEDDIRTTNVGQDRNTEDLNMSADHASSSELPLGEENDNVWSLIPELKRKLHLHQKRAFEFLWRNLAGAMVPAEMDPSSDNIGGCVISHSPGAGKTFLIIAFLASYLKLFPGKRPLVLAPKTTLYTWYKEFIKWEIPVPVHLIHGRRTYCVLKQNPIPIKGFPKPSQDVMHVLDCLDKIQKWHSNPSVLVMGYSSFQTLMREDSKLAHRKYMAKVLRESPGLLVLDEGHNPRSTKSRLRKALMKVDTDLRILLSGTLFQNNFCEYFNTLCLARPKFVHEILMELDQKFKTNQGVNKAPHLLENRARKFFLDIIAKKIDSSVGEERHQGLNMLRNMTNGFIDVYEGNGSGDVLPGLQIYTLLMNSTDVQHRVLMKLQNIMSTFHGYPLELELLITLAAIHPWLIKTSTCVSKFFNPQELADIERLKYDAKKGSKVMFVLNLVFRVVKREKILIFCHNIAPINLFLELFENVFRWRRGREILTLTGDLELFERGRVIDKFEEPGGTARVLLASITACAEGISLTAASRVIMLDSEWNPSKTKQAIARAFRPGQQKVVYVYQLLARGTLEEDKYRRTTWNEWVSSMIFSEEFVEDPSLWQAEKIEDDVLREIVEEDRVKSFHMIMKNEKASTG
ncbi:PREDICTED: SNF2 domain-containing protein CLASSY 2-like isoform X2 [Tarenaya hassleriana]|uniref:SNF2 domain-containing protein CLASSY 2-like isoform X2 n=1 Tax=Tarenaya hassleriana TaxID=28532 RepID=UPI00053C8E3B|nr:PREDICTED: SNF2 domain-containing protein CLASSY 2-like isoform X2 [Tarenaya hassleriana]XP_010535838.1 PREDICTED: SNF2 domain-containing protein CLASSY 2-like isoform X2 [Tarenaya hassleriana]XP_010535839.1 PREDICTED: SNF2 domain-containing protein CLASSY 2-like isoform X2 [Tarenaya hassleriana]